MEHLRFIFVEFQRQLVEEREDLNHQIKQLMLGYEGLEQGSTEELALGTTIASMRISFCKVQQKLLDGRFKASML